MRYGVIPKDLSRERDAAIFVYQIFVCCVVVIPHNASGTNVTLQEPVVLTASHSVIQQILVNCGVHMVPISKIQRQEPLLIEASRVALAGRSIGMKVLR